MNPTYLLWRAPDRQPLPQTIQEASASYRKRTGRLPSVALVHPSRMPEVDPSANPDLLVEPAPRLVWNPNEILIGDAK